MASAAGRVGADFLVVGGGIAGASLACFLAPHARVVVLERESHPAYHSTGRSAALFSEAYGTRQVRALSCASRPFFDAPPQGFAAHPILSRRGVLTVASLDRLAALHAHLHEVLPLAPGLRLLGGDEARAMFPVLRPEAAAAAVFEPDAFDVDVDALHQGYLRTMRRAGGELRTNAEVREIRRDAGLWRVGTSAGAFEAPVSRELEDQVTARSQPRFRPRAAQVGHTDHQVRRSDR